MHLYQALFENKSKKLWPFRFLKVRLILEILKNAILIPERAILYTTEGPQIFVVKNNITEQRKMYCMVVFHSKHRLVK